MLDKHFKNLISIYNQAPINKVYKPRMRLALGKCTIKMNILKSFHHSAKSLHGSVYFKMLDDAAWAASNTHVKDVFLFTYNFNVFLTKPVFKGNIKSVGEVIDIENTKISTKSVLFDSNDIEIATGEGVFIRSKYPLKDAIGFLDL